MTALLSALPGAISGLFAVGKQISDLTNSIAKSDLISTFSDLSSGKQITEAKASRAIQQAFSVGTSIAKESHSLARRINRGNSPDNASTENEFTKLALQCAPNKEAYLQILAQNAAYGRWKEGYQMPTSDYCEHAVYLVKKTIHYSSGITAVVFVSPNVNEAPLVVFRGTDIRNIDNVADDLTIGIGELNTTKHAQELESELELLAATHGRIHVIGHSYGGSIAQRLTARHPHLISRCTSHNAPGVGRKVVEEYKENINRLPSGLTKPHISSYRHAKDVASLFGGKRLPTDAGSNYTTGSVTDTISHIDAHSANTLSTGATIQVDVAVDDSLQQFAVSAEQVRGNLSRLIPLYRALRNYA